MGTCSQGEALGAFNNNASKGSDAQQWENCKTELSKMLVNKCSGTKILKVNQSLLCLP